MKVKKLGQVFTPESIVKDILDITGYYGRNILKKHIIDNSCGNGAFLLEIIDRYIKAYYEEYNTYEGLEKDLKEFIHGIEIDKEIYKECIINLDKKLLTYNIEKIKLDILNKDTLKVKKYHKKMDFVVGNPPYVRVHNLNEQYNSVKNSSFCENGMTDLYIVFYEIGLNMLNKTGILCYITPNSFYNSLAGQKLREYLRKNQNMEIIVDLGHYQPFSVSTYTTICKICKNIHYETCQYHKYNLMTEKKEFICNINYQDLFIDGNIILSNNNQKYSKYLNYDLKQNLKVQVKNGFATLNDDIFIQPDFNLKHNIIDVLKASTGKWNKCIYPYDESGKLISFKELGKDVQKYFKEKRSKLEKDKDKKIDTSWYGFGRSQAINDVKLNKIAINTCIKDIESIKLNLVEKGKGVYSGLYMLTEIPFEIIKEKIYSQDFIDYLKIVNKCKSGGYYTFSSKDLSKYINCSLEE